MQMSGEQVTNERVGSKMSLERDGQRPNCVVCLGYEKFFGLVLFVFFVCLFVFYCLFYILLGFSLYF